ncbi:MAG: glycosyltransferase family 39 protein [Candidatus Sumerlaeia bacterium]|nr:glycosyltransferase family 39 protein [Candidatus Sumerlaeia bacterium]
MEEAQRAAQKHTDLILCAALFLGTLLFLIATHHAYAMVWDEGFYAPTYALVTDWFALLSQNPGEAISPEAIKTHWALINELPPITKYLGALSSSLFAPLTGDHLLGMRLLFMILFSGTIVLLYGCARFLFPEIPRAVPVIAALLYATHPRLFAHGHIAATETPFAFLTSLVLFVALSPLPKYPKTGLLILLGVLACATKENGLILCVALGCYAVLQAWQHFGVERQPVEKRYLLFVALCLILSPVLLFLLWPWMWYETPDRLLEYWKFIRDHAHLGTWYFGERWNVENRLIPWHYPLVITALTTPVAMLLLMLGGGVLALRGLLRSPLPFNSPWWLVLLLILGPYSAMIVTGAPKYDGIRLFLPVFFPLTLLALQAIVSLTNVAPKYHVPMLATVLLLQLVETLPSARVGLSFYNAPTRIATPEGVEFPFETTYWMESIHPELFDQMLRDSGKSEIRILTRAVHPEVFLIQQQWGSIPANILFNGPPPYDYHLIQNRRGFWTNVDWWLYSNRESLYSDPLTPNDPRFFVFDGRPPYTE